MVAAGERSPVALPRAVGRAGIALGGLVNRLPHQSRLDRPAGERR